MFQAEMVGKYPPLLSQMCNWWESFSSCAVVMGI